MILLDLATTISVAVSCCLSRYTSFYIYYIYTYVWSQQNVFAQFNHEEPLGISIRSIVGHKLTAWTDADYHNHFGNFT